MLPIEQLEKLIQGKKVAFIGAGVSHKRCIEQFVELGAQVTLCDQKKSIEDFGDYADTLRRLNVALSLGEHYTGFAGQDIIMRTPGYEYFKPELQAAKAAGAMVTSEVELFFEFCPCEIVAVTGSDGKTTTTTLISKMFEAAGRKVFLGGNIGAALLPQLVPQPQGGGRHQRDPQPSGPPQGYAGVHRCQAQHPALAGAAVPCRAGLRERHHPRHAERLQGRAGLVHPPA